MSCMRDCDGWTFCFDVKERPDSTAVLTHVRVVRSIQVFSAPTVLATAEDVDVVDAVDVVDCTEPEDAQHPCHKSLLRLFRQPQQQMLDPNFWKQLVGNDVLPSLSIGNFDSKVVGEEEPSDMNVAGAYLQDMGFCRVQMPFNALKELAVAMERLQEKGFPPVAHLLWWGFGMVCFCPCPGISVGPCLSTSFNDPVVRFLLFHFLRPLKQPLWWYSKVFVFIFDQPWQMLQALFQPVAALLGKSPDDIHMSLSVTCPQKNEEAPKFYVETYRESRIHSVEQLVVVRVASPPWGFCLGSSSWCLWAGRQQLWTSPPGQELQRLTSQWPYRDADYLEPSLWRSNCW